CRRADCGYSHRSFPSCAIAFRSRASYFKVCQLHYNKALQAEAEHAGELGFFAYKKLLTTFKCIYLTPAHLKRRTVIPQVNPNKVESIFIYFINTMKSYYDIKYIYQVLAFKF